VRKSRGQCPTLSAKVGQNERRDKRSETRGTPRFGTKGGGALGSGGKGGRAGYGTKRGWQLLGYGPLWVKKTKDWGKNVRGEPGPDGGEENHFTIVGGGTLDGLGRSKREPGVGVWSMNLTGAHHWGFQELQKRWGFMQDKKKKKAKLEGLRAKYLNNRHRRLEQMESRSRRVGFPPGGETFPRKRGHV